MRITGGEARGQTIRVPPSKTIRPAQDMVRQAVFSMLRGLIRDTEVLDLFAGSGSYGLEALSRGAARATFVDIDKRCARTIRENLTRLGFAEKGRVVKDDAPRFVSTTTETFDLIFLSPPYRDGPQIHLLKSLAKLLNPRGVIIFDHAKRTSIPEDLEGLKVIKKRNYGATAVSLLSHR